MMRKMCLLAALLMLLPAPAEVQLRTTPYRHFYHEKNIIRGNWYSTRAYCKKNHGDMITIRDEVENRQYYEVEGWIGLYRKNSTSEWKWSRRDEIAKFLLWEDGDPNDWENCAYKKTRENGWHSLNCYHWHPYICNDELLFLVKEEKTWEEALVHCRTLEAKDPSKPVSAYENYKYDLATLLTDDDHEFAREKAQSATTDELWTGLRYLAGYWLWVGGEDVNYKDIKGCLSDGFCGTLPIASNKTYEIRSCEERRNFFCYKKPETNLYFEASA